MLDRDTPAPENLGRAGSWVVEAPLPRSDDCIGDWLSSREHRKRSKPRSRDLPAHIANTFANHTDHDLALLIAILQSPASHAKRAKVACELNHVL